VKILFLGRRFLYFRSFEDVIRELAVRGHQVHLAVEHDDLEGRPAFVDALLAEFPAITAGYAPPRTDDDWSWVAARLRLGLDDLRYQHRIFDDTPKLRDRARERTPGLFVSLCDLLRRRARWALRPATRAVRWLERAIPPDPAIEAFIDEQQPDVVLITPLIDLGSAQIDYLRAARGRRIPTALCVWSWDHLSSKALIRDCPERVLVWNETQKHEAVTLHDVPPERVVVTGAQSFDRWFDRQPSRDRETFCRAVGLPDSRPFLLYVCSAPFLGSQPEAPFVVEWIRRVRASAVPALRDAAILVRPHPSRTAEWEGIDTTVFGGVAVHGSSPVDAASRADYFDALFHSAAVVGLNTSALIEAGIVGRPVHTILLPEWYENQMGTLHFRYLFEAGGGLLQAGRDFDEHLRLLAQSVRSVRLEPDQTPQRSSVLPFVREFVRPHGLDVAATPLVVRAVEQLRGVPVQAAVSGRSRVAQRILEAMIRRRDDLRSERWLYSTREREVLARNREARAAKAEESIAARAREDARLDSKQARRDAEWARHRAAKAERAARDAEKAAR
jgi:hypothetical protein